MKILIAINKGISFVPFQYIVSVLKGKGHHVDIVVYPKMKRYCTAEWLYLKLENIYLQKIRHEIDTVFSSYKNYTQPLEFLPYIRKDAVYDYILNFCDSFPDDIRQIESNHKWFISNYYDKRCYGIDTIAFVMKNIGVTPLYILEASDNTVVYYSESLTSFPLIERNNTALLCKAINVIVRYISKYNSLQNSFSACQPMVKKSEKLNINWRIAALHLIRILCWKLKNAILVEQYNILIGENTKTLPPNPNLLKVISPPNDRLWADPCIIEHENMNYLFVEELIFSGKKGAIRCMAFKELNNIDEGEIVLEKPYHLSFPFVFKYNDKYYMLAETRQNRSIELYESIEFPNKWTKKKTFMKDVEAVDSFVVQKNDKWWLFANIAAGPGASCNDELHVFYADDPVNGKWIAHPLNPVVEGAGFSRNAGKLFEHEGRLYRPSQICVGHYGFGININEVIKLNVNEYEERCVHQITPSRADEFFKMHTMDWGIKYVALDGGSMLRKKLKNFIAKRNSLLP